MKNGPASGASGSRLRPLRKLPTSWRKAFLNPVEAEGAKARPGTQLTTTGCPPGQEALALGDASWASLQLDRWASAPLQLTE